LINKALYIIENFTFFFFQDVPTVRLRLRMPKSNKKVQWTQGTVDNENLNKKKSKCKYLLFLYNLLNFIYQKELIT